MPKKEFTKYAFRPCLWQKLEFFLRIWRQTYFLSAFSVHLEDLFCNQGSNGLDQLIPDPLSLIHGRGRSDRGIQGCWGCRGSCCSHLGRWAKRQGPFCRPDDFRPVPCVLAQAKTSQSSKEALESKNKKQIYYIDFRH